MATPRLKFIATGRVLYPHPSHGAQPDNCPLGLGNAMLVATEYEPGEILRQMVGVEKDFSYGNRLCWLRCRKSCRAKENVVEAFKDFLDSR